jgi:hypothetical protein
LPHTGAHVVLVDDDVGVTVVDVVAQPPCPHASQQLVASLGQPPRATHRSALGARRQRVVPA